MLVEEEHQLSSFRVLLRDGRFSIFLGTMGTGEKVASVLGTDQFAYLSVGF